MPTLESSSHFKTIISFPHCISNINAYIKIKLIQVECLWSCWFRYSSTEKSLEIDQLKDDLKRVDAQGKQSQEVIFFFFNIFFGPLHCLRFEIKS